MFLGLSKKIRTAPEPLNKVDEEGAYRIFGGYPSAAYGRTDYSKAESNFRDKDNRVGGSPCVLAT